MAGRIAGSVRMRITIAAVGKLRASSPYAALISEFARRTPWAISFREVEEKRPLPPEQLKAREAALLLASVPHHAKIIVLDEKGQCLTSKRFAGLIANWQERGEQSLAFLIGGAAGHGDMVKTRADFMLSLGEMTWPHMLVRGMLVEQLYRSYTLLENHPYHKE